MMRMCICIFGCLIVSNSAHSSRESEFEADISRRGLVFDRQGTARLYEDVDDRQLILDVPSSILTDCPNVRNTLEELCEWPVVEINNRNQVECFDSQIASHIVADLRRLFIEHSLSSLLVKQFLIEIEDEYISHAKPLKCIKTKDVHILLHVRITSLTPDSQGMLYSIAHRGAFFDDFSTFVIARVSDVILQDDGTIVPVWNNCKFMGSVTEGVHLCKREWTPCNVDNISECNKSSLSVKNDFVHVKSIGTKWLIASRITSMTINHPDKSSKHFIGSGRIALVECPSTTILHIGRKKLRCLGAKIAVEQFTNGPSTEEEKLWESIQEVKNKAEDGGILMFIAAYVVAITAFGIFIAPLTGVLFVIRMAWRRTR